MTKGSEYVKCAYCGKADKASNFQFWYNDKPFCTSTCLSTFADKLDKEAKDG